MNYDSRNRGKIQYRERARQIIDFSGIRYDNITPTDIDGFFEKADKAFVFYEYKLEGCEMPHGQRIALERIVDGLVDGGREATLMLCKHKNENPSDDIKASDAIVDKIYYRKEWYKIEGTTVKQMTDRFMDYIKAKGVA